MRRVNVAVRIMLASFVFAGVSLQAQEPVPSEERKVEISGPYRVAVLPFEEKSAGEEEAPQLGSKITDLLTASLSTDPNLELVERARLDSILDEHALNLTGMTGPAEQLRLGRLAGAQFLVLGRTFPLDRDTCVVAKIVSVETGKMTAVVSQQPVEGKLGDLVSELSKRLRGAFQEKAPALLPPLGEKEDVIAQIKEALGDRPLPQVLVTVEESHRSRSVPQVDPAVATELLFILKSCGFEVAEVESAEKAKQIRKWAVRFREDPDAPLPKQAADADVIIIGEAVSEFGARRGELISCIGRLELQAVDAKTGKTLAVARKTVRAVDLSEMIAAKTALQEGTASVAASFVPWTVEEWVKSVLKEKTKE